MPELVTAHLRIDRATLYAIPKDEVVRNARLVDNFEACTDGAKAFSATAETRRVVRQDHL